MRLSQRMSKTRGLKFHYSWQKDREYYVTVDGSLVSMQAMLEPLVNGTLSHAEASVGFGGVKARSAIARRLTIAYAEGLDEITDLVEHTSGYFGGIPNSYSFDVGRATHLKGHLRAFSTSLTMYHRGRIQPHQIAEESHTIIELLLRYILKNESDGRSFEEMVGLSIDKGIIDSVLQAPLLKLKVLRRNAKHKGQGISEDLMNEIMKSVLVATHQLVRLARR